jgi:hypothetical protein
MAYENKVLLMAVSEIMKKSKNLRDAHEAVAKIANVEGVILEPFGDREDDDEESEKINHA